MSSNYEWQKHQAYERIQARLSEAEVHRMLKAGDGDQPRFSIPVEAVILFGTVVITATWILLG